MLGGKEVALRQKFRVPSWSVLFRFAATWCLLGIIWDVWDSAQRILLPWAYPRDILPDSLHRLAILYVPTYLTNQILFPGSFFLSRRKPRPETAWIECFKFATGSKSWHPTGSRWVPRNERRLPWQLLPEGAKRNRQQSPNLRRQKLQVRIATYFTILY